MSLAFILWDSVKNSFQKNLYKIDDVFTYKKFPLLSSFLQFERQFSLVISRHI